MDARRLGMGAGLPQAFLEAAAPGYLTDTEWDGLGEDWREQALAYAAVPCKGARGPLTRIRPRPANRAARHRGDQPASITAAAGPLYRLADYLDQHGRVHRATRIPPPEFWSAAAAHAAPGDQAALGDAAHDRGLYRDATQLHKNAAAAGNTRAASSLSDPPACLRTDPRPAHWAAAHAALDNPHAVASLLGSLRQAGAHDQAAALAARAAAHAALDNPGDVARLLGSPQQMAVYEQVAPDGSLRATMSVDRLWQAGAHEQAAALLARDPAAHAALDDPHAVARQQPGQLAQALGVLQAHDRAVVAHGPVLTLPAKHGAGGLGGKARCLGQAISHCVAVTICRHERGQPRRGPVGQGRAAAVVHAQRRLAQRQPPDQRAIDREDPTRPCAEHQHHAAGPVDQRLEFPDLSSGRGRRPVAAVTARTAGVAHDSDVRGQPGRPGVARPIVERAAHQDDQRPFTRPAARGRRAIARSSCVHPIRPSLSSSPRPACGPSSDHPSIRARRIYPGAAASICGPCGPANVI
jgi:hypothetical protein